MELDRTVEKVVEDYRRLWNLLAHGNGKNWKEMEL